MSKSYHQANKTRSFGFSRDLLTIRKTQTHQLHPFRDVEQNSRRKGQERKMATAELQRGERMTKADRERQKEAEQERLKEKE